MPSKVNLKLMMSLNFTLKPRNSRKFVRSVDFPLCTGEKDAGATTVRHRRCPSTSPPFVYASINLRYETRMSKFIPNNQVFQHLLSASAPTSFSKSCYFLFITIGLPLSLLTLSSHSKNGNAEKINNNCFLFST